MRLLITMLCGCAPRAAMLAFAATRLYAYAIDDVDVYSRDAAFDDARHEATTLTRGAPPRGVRCRRYSRHGAMPRCEVCCAGSSAYALMSLSLPYVYRRLPYASMLFAISFAVAVRHADMLILMPPDAAIFQFTARSPMTLSEHRTT